VKNENSLPVAPKSLKNHDSTAALPQLLLLGGFLGAGKTTLIGAVTRHLQGNGVRVGLITNDQGIGLMDTESAELHAQESAAVKEITGGCFCCRLDQLVEALSALQAEKQPQVMIAEPVGSCTDLMATVVLPLQSVYQSPFRISPLCVTLDARRALTALGGKRSARDFHRDIGYVFHKQIEEAEWLIVNKCDLLAEEDLADLRHRITEKYPTKKRSYVSARTGDGIPSFVEQILASTSNPDQLMEVDYQRYAEGEAMLGWCNSEVECARMNSQEPWPDLEQWLLSLAQAIAEQMELAQCAVGHFKMSLTHQQKRYRVHQVISGEVMQVETDTLPTDSQERALKLLINLRAEGDATDMQQMIDRALAQQNELHVHFVHQAAFHPGKPTPTHRVAALH
jgi:G3E family GTPase